MCCEAEVQLHTFACGYPVVPAPFIDKTILSLVEWSWCHCWKSIDHKCLCLFLASLLILDSPLICMSVLMPVPPSLFSSIYLFISFWLHWVFVAVHGLSLFVASWGSSSLWCAGFSLQWHLLLWSTGSRREGFSSCGTRLSSCGLWALERRLSSCGAQA